MRSKTLRLGDREVRRVGFGALRVLGPNAFGPPSDPEQARTVLTRAAAAVDVIDTADCYGPGWSENLIADALHPYRDGLVLATKGGQTCPRPGVWLPSGRPDRLKRCCEASLLRLKLARIELYQLHCIDPAVGLEPSVRALAELREEGMIRHVGLCNVTADELRRAQQTVPIVAVQNRYNLMDRASDLLLEVCEQEDIAFLSWFPLNQGALACNGGPLKAVARTRGATPAQVAIAWLLQRSPVMLPIPGTGSVRHLNQNVAASKLVLDGAALQQLEEPTASLVDDIDQAPGQ